MLERTDSKPFIYSSKPVSIKIIKRSLAGLLTNCWSNIYGNGPLLGLVLLGNREIIVQIILDWIDQN